MIKAMRDTDNLGTTSRRAWLPAAALLVALSVVLLACATTSITRNQRPGVRVPLRQYAVPSDSIIRAAIVTMLDSTGDNRLDWVLCATDGSFWLLSSWAWNDRLRHCGPDGRVLGPDRSFARQSHESQTAPLCQMDDSLILMTVATRVDWGACLMCSAPRGKMVLGENEGYSQQTTLVGEDGVVHVFGYPWREQVYARYQASGDSVLLVGGRREAASNRPPWYRDPRTVMSWTDTDGVAVALTLVDNTGTVVASRFAVPGMEMLDSVRFSVTGSANFRAAVADCRHMGLVRVTDGFWAFVPSSMWQREEKGETGYVYACRLDRNLRPMRAGPTRDQEPLPYSQAPPGSGVLVDTHDDISMDPPWVVRHQVTTSFLAYGPDGHVYRTRAEDTALYEPRRDTVVVTEDGSLGSAILSVPFYPLYPLAGGIEGWSVVTVVIEPSGAVDTAFLTRSSGSSPMDRSALHVARATRFAGPAASPAKSWRALDIRYDFVLVSKRQPTTRVAGVRVRELSASGRPTQGQLEEHGGPQPDPVPVQH